MENYILGLDLGTNSVGWAVVECDDQSKPIALADFGVWIMADDSIEQDQTDGQVSTQRRQRGLVRRARRNLRRRRQRRNKLLSILLRVGLLPEDEKQRVDVLNEFGTNDNPQDPYSLRAKALDNPLQKYELGKVLYHFVRHRGYLSTRDLIAGKETEPTAPKTGKELTEQEKEEQGILGAITRTKQHLKEANARTFGEYLSRFSRDRQTLIRTRTKDGRKGGIRGDRWLLRDEFNKIKQAQADHHPQISPYDWEEIECAIFDQRPLSSKAHRKGHCSFHKTHKRATKASLVFQESRIWQLISTLKIVGPGFQDGRWLTPQERQSLFEFLNERDKASFREVADFLGFGDRVRLKGCDDDGVPTIRVNEIKGNQLNALFGKAIPEHWYKWTYEQKERFLNEFTTLRTASAKHKRMVEGWGLSEDEALAVLDLRLPQGYGKLCAKCLRRIAKAISQSEEHKTYNQALEEYGKRHTEVVDDFESPKLIPFFVRNLNNPVVERAVREAVRVIASAVRAYGKPRIIRIEMPRELSKSNKERQESFRIQDENWRKRKNAEKQLIDHGMPVTETNIEKVRLLLETDMRDPYEPGKQYGVRDLNELEIDHIVPRSISLDNSWTNRTVTHKDNNLQKGNRTPYEKWGQDPKRWAEIEQHAKHLLKGKTGISKQKVERILSSEKSSGEELIGQALSDTRYICRETKRFLEACGFAVEVGNGRITAELRRRWELDKVLPLSEDDRNAIENRKQKNRFTFPKNRSDHRHHAIDALATACTDRRMVQALARYFQDREGKCSQVKKHIRLPKPWPNFTEDAKKKIENARVAIKPTRNVRGSINELTALKPVSEEEFLEVLKNAPKEARERAKRALIANGKMYVFGRDGKPYKMYKLGNNHHCVIWERENPKKPGQVERDLTVVTMAEALHRVRKDPRSLFVSEPPGPGWRQVMCPCKNDMVEWEGDNPGVYMVASFSVPIDMFLRFVYKAKADKRKDLRITGRQHLLKIRSIVSPIPIIGV